MMRYLPVSVALAGTVAWGLAGAADESPLARYQYTQLHMGVQVRIVVYAPSRAAAETACEAAFERFAQLDQTLSDYRPSSEINRLCDAAGGPPVRVSRDLYRVLERAQQVSRRSGGAFDVTVGPLVALWRAARKSGRLPADPELRAARALVGWRKVRLLPRERAVRLATPGMRLDLGGIAKGYAGDCAQAVLRRRGIRSALVEAGGDIVVSDAPPGRAGWEIEAQERGGTRTLVLANSAVSTSGDTEQFVEVDGRRYSHVVDPRTGLGLTTRVAATVVAPDGLTSDPLSTAVCILGPEKGPAFAAAWKRVRATVRRAGDPSPAGTGQQPTDPSPNRGATTP